MLGTNPRSAHTPDPTYQRGVGKVGALCVHMSTVAIAHHGGSAMVSLPMARKFLVSRETSKCVDGSNTVIELESFKGDKGSTLSAIPLVSSK